MTETTIEERIISGTGVLRVPATEAAYRYYSLLCDVIRQPSRTDRSFRYNPYRQRFGTLVFLRGGYVIAEQPLDYTRRRFDFVLDAAGQALIGLKCSHSQVLSLVGGGSPPSSVIEDFANLNMLWDEVRLTCYLDTAFQLKLRADLYDECGQDYREKAPPPPPAPLSEVTPGTPISDISPPYDDDEVTSPYPGDEAPVDPPDPTPSGQRLNVVIQWFINDLADNARTSNIFVWGDALDVRSIAIDGLGHLQLLCFGAAPTTGDPVSPTAIWVDVLTPDGNPNRYGNVNQPSIVSATPV